MPPIIQFIFFYAILPYGAVISLGVFSRLEKRESVETIRNAEAARYPLTTIWTWLTLAVLVIFEVFRFFELALNMADLLSGEIIVAAYFLSFVVLSICALGFVLIRLVLGLNKRNERRPLSLQVLIPFAALAVFSTLYGSTIVMEFFNRAFLIGH